jgi:hypothetical protein
MDIYPMSTFETEYGGHSQDNSRCNMPQIWGIMHRLFLKRIRKTLHNV